MTVKGDTHCVHKGFGVGHRPASQQLSLPEVDIETTVTCCNLQNWSVLCSCQRDVYHVAPILCMLAQPISAPQRDFTTISSPCM